MYKSCIPEQTRPNLTRILEAFIGYYSCSDLCKISNLL
jgi:hypothetical protein